MHSFGVHLQKTWATFLCVKVLQSVISRVQLMVVEMHPRILDIVGTNLVVVVVVVEVMLVDGVVSAVVGATGASLTTLFLKRSWFVWSIMSSTSSILAYRGLSEFGSSCVP